MLWRRDGAGHVRRPPARNLEGSTWACSGTWPRNQPWDWRTFDLDRDTSLIDKKAGFIDAVNPDLSAFRARGGKLLIYHGWNDGGSGGAISPQNSVNYYSSVLARMGPQQEDWLRLFMVPGMAHCGGGPGPNQVNWMAALERWCESGIAPDRLIASRVSDNRVNMTRPVCPYPQVAQYTGVGSTNDAANFVIGYQADQAGHFDSAVLNRDVHAHIDSREAGQPLLLRSRMRRWPCRRRRRCCSFYERDRLRVRPMWQAARRWCSSTTLETVNARTRFDNVCEPEARPGAGGNDSWRCGGGPALAAHAVRAGLVGRFTC